MCTLPYLNNGVCTYIQYIHSTCTYIHMHSEHIYLYDKHVTRFLLLIFLLATARSMLRGFHLEWSIVNFYSPYNFPLPCSQHEFNAVHFLLLKPKQSMVLQIPARLQVCPHGLVVHMTDKMKVFELMAFIKEIYHISDIREVCSLYCFAWPLNVLWIASLSVQPTLSERQMPA